MKNETRRVPRTIIRIGRQSLYFVLPAKEGENVPSIMPFTVKSGMSMAANLRAAFREHPDLTGTTDRVQVVIDTPVALIPMEEYEEGDVEKIFRHSFPSRNNEAVVTHVVPDLNCVAVFSVNKDLRMVITDHYRDVRIMPAVVPVCRHLHQHSYVGIARKLYAHLHDGQLTISSYATNRFRFMNTYGVKAASDVVYFVLYIWQQLGMSAEKDELYIVGDAENKNEVKTELQKYVTNVFSISPSAEFNRAPMTRLQHITYDIICLCES